MSTALYGFATMISAVAMTHSAQAQYIGETVIVRSADGTLNIRSGAATDFQILDVLQNGDSLVVLEESGSWVRVSGARQEGWVFTPMLEVPSNAVMTQLIADNPDAHAMQIKRGFDQFDGAVMRFYDTEVNDYSALSQLVGLKELYIGDHTFDDLSSLAQLTALETLVLDEVGFGGLNNFAVLADFAELKELEILFADLDDLSPLAQLDGLGRLVLYRTGTHDVTALAGLPNLVMLDLSQNPLTDLSPLARLPALQTLVLNEMSDLQDLSPLSNLGALRRLELLGTFGLDTDVLSQNPNLEIVTVSQ